jgi:NADH:ubiquinone oxidoreductase subunit 4 (subunit M)
MNFSLFGLFSNTIQGIEGGLFLMLGHGFVSSALFLSIGILYERYHTRLIKYYSGLTIIMPIFSIIFLLLSLSNLGLPGTSNFIGEILILVGIFQNNIITTLGGSIGILLSSLYSI